MVFPPARRFGHRIHEKDRRRTVANRSQSAPVSHRLQNSQTRSCSEFPFAVFYEVTEDEIQVIAVFHSRRDPEVWKSRLG